MARSHGCAVGVDLNSGSGSIVSRCVLLSAILLLLPAAARADDSQRVEQLLTRAENNARALSRHGVLDACLRLLALNDARRQDGLRTSSFVPDVLDAMLDSPTQGTYRPDESVREALTRWLDPPPAKDVCRSGTSFDALRLEYLSLTGHDWSLEWRKNDAFWRDFTVDLLESRFADDPAAVWRRRIVDDPQRAELYRFAYLEVVRPTSKPIDRSLIEPLLIDGNASIAFDRLVLVRSALSVQRDLAEWKTSLDAKLLQMLTSGNLDLPHPEDARHLYRLAQRVPTETRLEFIRAIVDRLPAYQADSFLPWLKGNDRAFFAKQTAVELQKVPLHDALSNLSSRVILPLWIDAEALRDEITVTKTASGPWLHVVEEVLAGTPYRVAVLDRGILWIGKPEKRDEAAAFVGRALEKSPEHLVHPAQCDFVETPWQDCLAYLSDFTETPIVAPWLGEQPKERTFTCSKLPASLTLELLTQGGGLDWLGIDQSVVVMPVAHRAAVQRAIERHRVRNEELAALELQNNPLWELLRTPSDADGAHNLNEVAQIARAANINVVLPQGEPVTIPWTHAGQMPWSTFFTTALLETDLTWDTDGALIFVGDTEQAATFRARAARRSERRQAAKAEVGKTLTGRVDVSFDSADRQVVSAWLKAYGAAPMGELPQKALTIHLKQVPLEAALDVVTLQLGLDWSIGPNGIEVR